MADNKPTRELIKDVSFAFVKMAESDKKYESEDRDYSLNAVVSKAQYKDFKKRFPKQSAKEYDRDEFEQKFKMAAPYDGDEVYVIKLAKAHVRDGKESDERYRPKVYLRNEDGSLTDITTSRLVANGSKGDVAIRVTTNKFGTFGFLDSICIEEFIEYKKEGGGGADSLFGGKVVNKEPENKAATQARASKAKEEAPVEEELSDDVPF